MWLIRHYTRGSRLDLIINSSRFSNHFCDECTCHLQSGARYQMDQLWMINYDGRFIDLIKGHVCEAARDEAKCSTPGKGSFSLISKQPFTVPTLRQL